MKTYQTQDLRNIAIVGHASSGKTMLTESMLVCGGVANRLGSIDGGSTNSDYHTEEKDRKISIHSSLLHLEWLEKKINVLDTPGYLDFISEAISSIRVADLAVIVINAAHGLGVGTEKVWDYATQFGIPKLFVMTGLDKEHINYEETLAQIRARFGERVFPLTKPVNAGPGFNKLLDVMRNELMTFESDGSGKFTEAPAEGADKEEVSQLHAQLIEYIAESDDTLLEKFFAEGGLSEEEMRGGVHDAFTNQSFLPLFCVSGETNIGVARLLDFVSKYGAAPNDRPNVEATDANGETVEVALADADSVLYVFKTMNEAAFGEVSFFRAYAGTLQAGQDLANAKTMSGERLGQIYTLNGKNRTSLESMPAGDIGATVKLKNTHTGNTLCSGKRKVEIAPVIYPKPNIHAALRLKSKGEEDKIAAGLVALHEEDQTFIYRVDGELHQTVISGQGELHLQVLANRLKARYRVDFDLIEPKVPYRETIKGRGEAKYRHKKQTGGAGQFAEVWMRIEPKERDSGVEFTESLVGQNVDRVFVPSVEKGVNTACREGILAGYRIVDLKVNFYDGKMHPVDSKDVAFQLAGREAFREAFLNAKPCMLEPICVVEIRIPEECMGNVIGDLSGRRGKILGMDTNDGMQVVKAHVPQKELYQYSTVLRSLTGGRSLHTEEFSHYEEMPKDMEAKAVAESKKAKEEDDK